MLGFEPTTCRFEKFCKGKMQKKFGPKNHNFFE